MNIEKELGTLGLTDKEASIYIALLKRGRATASNLSMLTGVNRTTVYSATKELARKGIIAEDTSISPTIYIAENPKDLEALLRRQERALTSKRELLNKVTQALAPLTFSGRYTPPKIQFVPEERIVDFLNKRTPIWNESVHGYDNIWWVFQDSTFVECYFRWINDFWEIESTERLKIVSFAITNASEIESTMTTRGHTRREVKFWDQAENTSTLWALGDYLILAYTREHPHYLIEIHDRALAANVRNMIKGLWKTI